MKKITALLLSLTLSDPDQLELVEGDGAIYSMRAYAVDTQAIWDELSVVDSKLVPVTVEMEELDADDVDVIYGNLVANPWTFDVIATLDGNYSGWTCTYGSNTYTYDFGSRFTMPAYDTTFTLVAAPDVNKTISGTVSGTDLTGHYSGELEGIGIQVVQGGDVIATATTSGYETINGVGDEGTAITLDYAGNINGVDAGRVNAFLHDTTTAEAMQERL